MMQDRVPQARIIQGVERAAVRDRRRDLHRACSATCSAGGKTSRLYKRLVYKDRIATDVAAFLDDREIASQLLVWADGAARRRPAGGREGARRGGRARSSPQGPTPAELDARADASTAPASCAASSASAASAASRTSSRAAPVLPRASRRLQGDARDRAARPRRRPCSRRRAALDDRRRVRPRGARRSRSYTVHGHRRRSIEAAGCGRRRRTRRCRRSSAPRCPTASRCCSPGAPPCRSCGSALVLDAGFAADDPQRPGVSSMAMAMLDEGTTTRSALQIADQLRRSARSSSAGSQLDASTAQHVRAEGRLDPALDLYADVVLQPGVPESDLARVKQNTLARIQQEKVEPIGLALRVLPRLLYGARPRLRAAAHGLRHRGVGQRDDARPISRSSTDLVQAEHATLIVVGRHHARRAHAETRARAFAAWKPGDVPQKNIGAGAAADRTQLYLLDRPGAEQSHHPRRHRHRAEGEPRRVRVHGVQRRVRRRVHSRVNMNLREDKHWSYGAGSFAFDARGQRPWLMYAPVQTDKTKESVQELLKEMRGVVERPAASRPRAGTGAGPYDAHAGRALGNGRQRRRARSRRSSPTTCPKTTTAPTPRRCARSRPTR